MRWILLMLVTSALAACGRAPDRLPEVRYYAIADT